MNFNLYDLLLWSAVVGTLAYWWHSSGIKSRVLTTARRHCRERGLQFLDDSLVFRGYRILRHPQRGPRLLRRYEFDFCNDGESRFRGSIESHGQRILSIVLETDQLEITHFP